MTSDATSLRVVDLDSADGTDLCLFDIVKVDIVGRCVADAEEEHGISELAMQPNVFVEREEAQFRTDPAHYGAAHGEKNKHSVDAEDHTGTAGDPNRVLEGVEACEALV